jgi:alkylhydroperoxidase family enzyme
LKFKALLVIASKVQRGGKHVPAEDTAHARSLGATDVEIHDAVLIAAAFCMYNVMWTALIPGSPVMQAYTRKWVSACPSLAI